MDSNAVDDWIGGLDLAPPDETGDDDHVQDNYGAIPSSAGSAPSTISDSSSARRQVLLRLRMSDTGVDFVPLTLESAPAVVKPLLETMSNIAQGFGVVPDALKDAILNDQGLTRDALENGPWMVRFKIDETPDDLPGRIPSIAQLNSIVKRAHECEACMHDDVSWNAMVNLPLLRLVFESDAGVPLNGFNAMLCAKARAHWRFRSTSSAGRMDMLVYATLDQEPELKKAAERFSEMSPTHTVNFTNTFATRFCPVVLNVKTSDSEAGWDKAQLQMGLWHAAQWEFLAWGTRQKLAEQAADEEEFDGTPEDEGELKAKAFEALSKLGFMPGMIVRGGDWRLVFSTYSLGKTMIWTGAEFGSTRDLMRMYSVVAGVRELTAWGRDTYLPWFRENVLFDSGATLRFDV